MKTIGLLGGMSWESTVSYYRALNEGVKAARGGLHSARIILNSLEFAEIETLQSKGDWQALADILVEAGLSVERAGADGLLICTNTMHKVAPEVQAALSIPLLHIADATGEVLKSAGIRQIGLLGTRYTMEQPFYRDRIEQQFGIDVLVPDLAERDAIHRIIFEELCQGVISDASRSVFLDAISALAGRGAQGVILGCTEIALLVKPSDTDVPLFDTTQIHVDQAVRWVLDIAR
ncbi:aspartate/glutamate racemase family protein [Marinobacter sp. BGYM27]|uniref:aspartate/glutamate racemase family protein n=1 Tax=Marinobacter sp. BGYM27 TaxID=2975597 RepID=UPI0021A2E333|nr:aspartate/glutamate racemase family protein [Marinobacter sp. BGYM27]